jgi:hypothetical protein
MEVNDYVVYIADPDLYGVGMVRAVLGPDEESASRLTVDFDGQLDDFSAHELELASVWAARRDVKEAA